MFIFKKANWREKPKINIKSLSKVEGTGDKKETRFL